MQRTMPAEGRLVVVPIPDDVEDAEVLRAMRAFLVGHQSGPRCAALVMWDEDGDLVARDIEPDEVDESPNSPRNILRMSLAALLAEMFTTGVRTSWSREVESDEASAHTDELSMSFLREVHDFVTPKTTFVALLTDWVDPGAIVRELRHLDGLRVIYGGVPPRWAASPA